MDELHHAAALRFFPDMQKLRLGSGQVALQDMNVIYLALIRFVVVDWAQDGADEGSYLIVQLCFLLFYSIHV